VIGGLIVGNPSDTRESIQANLLFAQRYIDWPSIQHPTPYPRTPMTKGLRERGLISRLRRSLDWASGWRRCPSNSRS
jgi:anaerobic magnesium-protoporphyrin IX monomethyl ester cyclase